MMTPDPSATQYPWATYSAQHLYGEPDCTFVPLASYGFDFTIEPASDHWQLEGHWGRLYPNESSQHN